MTFTRHHIESALEEYGEISVVLDSGTTYELHAHNTEFDADGESVLVVLTDKVIDGHVTDVTIPLDAIEHYTVHY